MSLETDEAVDDVHAGFLELLAPVDVVLLVESCLDLDECEHLLAVARCFDQGLDDGRVTARAVEGLLDGEHVRVDGRLLEEELHARGERVVGMVDEDVLLAHLGEDVGSGRRLDLCESAARAWHKARLLEIVSIHGVEGPQPGEVERPGQAEDLRLAHIELIHEQLEHVRVDRTLDLEADGRPEAASRELALECLEEILGVVLLHLDVFVARHAEGVVLEDVHAREELVEVCSDDRFELDEALGPDRDETRQRWRDLDAGEELGAGDGIAYDDSEIERQSADVWEGMTRVDREGGEYGEDPLIEERVELGSLIRREGLPVEDLHAVRRESRPHLIAEDRGLL